jgi:ankyrin repeat protein
VTMSSSARRAGIASLFAAVLALAAPAPAAVAEGGEGSEGGGAGPESEFLDAVKANDLARAAKIAEGLDLNLLAFAIGSQDDALFEYGLSESRNADAMTKVGWTPLMYACQVGRLDYIDALVKKGADVNAPKTEPPNWEDGLEGAPPSGELWMGDALQVAIQAGQWRVIRYLLDGGAAPTVYDLEAALNSTMTSLADELLLRGVKPRDATLVAACRAQDLRMATEFLGMGLDPNARDYNGQTALGVAREARFDALARLLESRGARDPERDEGK